jgi:hypothetical protein
MVLAIGVTAAGMLSLALYLGSHFRPAPEPKDQDQETSRLHAEVASLRTAIHRLSRRPPPARAEQSVAPGVSAAPIDDGAQVNRGLTLGDVLSDLSPEKQEDFLEQLGNKENIARKERTLAQLASEPETPLGKRR